MSDDVGNLVPMRAIPDTAAARRSGIAPDGAWQLLDAARRRGLEASLTWCLGWTPGLVPDATKPLTAAGAPGRSRAPVTTESVALRVPGLLWAAWERQAGGAWKAVGGQARTDDGDGTSAAQIARITAATAKKMLTR